MCASTVTRAGRRPAVTVRTKPEIGFVQRHAVKLALLLCILAAARIFVFSAAFPLFSPVDEPYHFDHVWQVSRGHIPTGLERVAPRPAWLISLYSSPEFLGNPRDWPDGTFPPPLWSMSSDVVRPYVESFAKQWRLRTNHEEMQPPVYYVLAAGWYRMGEAMGLSEGPAIHWIRFLNVLVYGLFVWVSYALVRKAYPAKPMLWVGVCVLVTFWPQDAFYQIGNDCMSPLLCALALYGLLTVCKDKKGIGFHVLAGIAVAAAFLGKYTNSMVLIPLAIAIGVKILGARRRSDMRAQAPRALALIGGAALPVLAWFVRNYMIVGSPTFSGLFTEYAVWIKRPFFWDMWYHPIFSPQGAAHFWSQLMALFWRGEFTWSNVFIAWRPLDLFYAFSSAAFLIAATVMIARRRGTQEAWIDGAALAMLAGGVAMLVWMSLRYDFGYWPNPSRAVPYFWHGRLISGALLPFAILYVKGLDALLTKLRLGRYSLVFLLLICIVATYIEVSISAPTFRSPYNWFHIL